AEHTIGQEQQSIQHRRILGVSWHSYRPETRNLVSTLQQQLVSSLLAGVERVLRYERLRAELATWASDHQPAGRTFVLAIGKAALSMTEAAAQVLPDVTSALVVVPHDYPESWPRALPFADRVEVAEGAHPLPDASSIAAASAVERFLTDLTADDEVLV